MNKLKDFNGLFVWMEGMCIAASDTLHNEFPFPRVLISSPYCHSVAKDILDGKSNIRLIAPFRAEEEHFTYDGKDCVSRKIVDTSLPLFLKDNPMKLRTAAEREAVFSRQAPLQEQIQAAEEKKTHSPGMKEPLIDHIR